MIPRALERPLVAGATAALWCALVATTAASATPTVVDRAHLADGVSYRRIDDPAIPIRTFLLVLRPGYTPSLDGVLSGDQIGTYRKTSDIGRAVGALGAINGGLNSSPGRPTHQYVRDGVPMVTGKRVGVSFGFRRDETGGTMGRHPLRINAVNKTTGASVRVRHWNEHSPGSDQVVGYTWYGGAEEEPSTNQCLARLVSPTKPRWNAEENGTHRSYTVDAVSCTTVLSVTRGSVVLSSRTYGAGATFIKALHVGDGVRLGWRADSRGVLDIVSGNTMVLVDGHVMYPATCDTRMCRKNPRTAIGITANGRVMMLVVDGRSSGSEGFTLNRLGRWMRELGVVDAVNLDGGGSATMWIAGLGVVNKPTDSDGERPVSNAVVILPGMDQHEVAPRPVRI